MPPNTAFRCQYAMQYIDVARGYARGYAYCVRPPRPARPDSEPEGTQFLRPSGWRYFLRMAKLLYAVATVGIVLGCPSCACSPDVTPPTPKKSATTTAKPAS